ncbi:hypothetical protein AAG906_018845 [Vitis piasezkii]
MRLKTYCAWSLLGEISQALPTFPSDFESRTELNIATIQFLKARHISNIHGNLIVEVDIDPLNGTKGSAATPSGASIGGADPLSDSIMAGDAVVSLSKLKTWESIPLEHWPLPNRLNVILTRPRSFDIATAENVVICRSMAAALELLATSPYCLSIEKVFVIGSGQILKEALDAPGHESQIQNDGDSGLESIKFEIKKDDGTGNVTLSKFGCQMRFNLLKTFPLLTTKKVLWFHVTHGELSCQMYQRSVDMGHSVLLKSTHESRIKQDSSEEARLPMRYWTITGLLRNFGEL